MARIKYSKHLPTYISPSIFTIDYKRLKEQGIRTLIFDYDNTISGYHSSYPSKQAEALFERLKGEGFSLIVISNGKEKRIAKVVAPLDVPHLAQAWKPLAIKVKKKFPLEWETVAFIGDQLMTDVALANKLGATSIKVSPVDSKVEPLRTKFNRKREEKRLKYFRKKGILKEMEVG